VANVVFLMSETDLIIIGGGAAGLMGGCTAGEVGLRTVILERKHKPGRKLLMCGNSRCNLTINISPERMIQMYGEPVGPFLRQAITDFPPSTLQRWFAANGLKTVVRTGNKVYPHTDRASDVLHFFTDFLRDRNVSLAASSVVQSLKKTKNGFHVVTDNFTLESRFVLIATGGISYPKTGSVGDGQKFAKELGHSLEPYRPGLVGFEVDRKVIGNRVGQEWHDVRVKILSCNKLIAETRGFYEIEQWGIGGTAVTDASRIIARLNLKDYVLRIELADGQVEEFKPLRPRSIKEAMVTMGGVSLKDVNNRTMESLRCQSLYFAGEVLDVDGPTGGYNLQSAFATARLAVNAIANKLGKPAAATPIQRR
jgi:predicted Rossmann fold flavoprotein